MPASGFESPAAVVLDLAKLDGRNGFGVRALTRSRAAIAALPPVAEARLDKLDWMRSVSVLLNVVSGQFDATGTAAGMSVAALEWASGRIRALLALPGVPPEGVGTTPALR